MGPRVHYVLTKAHHLSPSWDRWIPSMHSASLRSIFHLHRGVPSGVFPSCILTRTPVHIQKKSFNVVIIVGTWCLFPRHLLRAIAASSGAPCRAVAVPFDCLRQSRCSPAMSCIIFHLPNLHCSLPMQLTVEMDISFAGRFSDISFLLKCVNHYTGDVQNRIVCFWCSCLNTVHTVTTLL